MKQYLRLSLMLGCLAVVCPTFAYKDNGPYLGIGVGADSTRMNTDMVYTTTPTENLNRDFGLAGADFQAHLGYQLYLNQRYGLGFEFATDWVTGRQHMTVSGDRLTYYRGISYSWNELPGIYFHHLYLYVPVGIVLTHYRMYGNDFNVEPNIFDEDRWGWDVGLGVSTPLTQHISLSMRYLYTGYFDRFSDTKPYRSGSSIESTDQMHDQRFLLALNYHFKGIDLAKTVSAVLSTTRSFYAGAYLGYDNSTLYRDLSIIANANATSILALYGVDGGPFVGYRLLSAQPHRVGLSLEAFADYSNSDSPISFPNNALSNMNALYRHSYGVTLNPTVYISPYYQLYAKLGYVNATFELNGNFLSSRNLAFERDFNGGTLGVGTQLQLCQRLALRLEYDAAWYPSYQKFGTGVARLKIQPTTHQFKLGLSYDLF